MSAFFGELYLRSTRPFFSPERTAREVGYLSWALGEGAAGPVLDLGCGHGRHASALAAQGRRVVGLEMDPLTLAEREGGFWAVQGDFRAPPVHPVFALAYAWYSTLFGDDDVRNRHALAAAAGCLRVGGRFIFESVPRGWLAANPRAAFHRTLPDGSRLDEESAFDPTTGCDTGARQLRLTDGRVLSGQYRIRYYEPEELKAMAEEAGLAVSWVHGDLDRGPLSSLSSEIIVGFTRLA